MNKLLLARDKFMPELHLNQPGFTYGAYGPFIRNKERVQKFMHAGDTDFIYRNELDEACFEHDMAYGKSKDLAQKTQLDKVLRGKALKIESDPKYDGYQRGLPSMLYKFFDKKSCGSSVATEPNYQLANGLHKQILESLKGEKLFDLLEARFGVLV